MAVFMPKSQKNDDLSTLISIGQTAGGAFSGNPMMVAQGVAGLDDGSKNAPQQTMIEPSTAPSAMQNRLNTMREDPLMTLATAKEALAYQPADIQKEYGSTIEQALRLAQQSRQTARV